MITTLLIDDEPKIRSLLKNTIDIFCPELKVIGEADSVKSGISAINSHQPQLVLLDINLGNNTAFDLLQQLTDKRFKIIFITAHHEHAVKAFKFSAIDFILKPIDPEELQKAVTRAITAIKEKEDYLKLEVLFNHINNTSDANKKLVIKGENKYHIVQVNNLIRCESDRNYTFLFLNTGQKIIASKTLKEFTELLESFGFIRVHHSHLINVNYINSFEKKRGGNVIMQDNSSIPIAPLKRKFLIDYMENL